METERIDCTRDQFAQMFGYCPSPDVIGVRLSDANGRVHKEFIFLSSEDLRLAQQCIPVSDRAQIAELERLSKL